MSMEIQQGRAPTERDTRIAAIFAEIESKQLELLDNAGKNLIDRIAALLAVLFAVTAFGDKFPPPYLKTHPGTKYLALITLAFYLGAMFAAVLVILPRTYLRYDENLTRMEKELGRIVNYKSARLNAAHWLFWTGAAFMAALVGLIVITA